MWSSIVSTFQAYMGIGLLVLWYFASLVYLFRKEEKKPARILFVYVPFLILLLYFNPLFVKLFYLTVGEEIYFRIFWLLPMVVTNAYALIMVCLQLPEKKKKWFPHLAVLLIIVSGSLVYLNPLYSLSENRYHVPQTVVDICDEIRLPGREVMAAFPREFLLYVRQYSPYVCMPYGREYLMGTYDEMAVLMDQEEIEVEKMAPLAKARMCHYVIVSEEKKLIGNMEDFDYVILDEIDGYIVYKDLTMNYDLTYSAE